MRVYLSQMMPCVYLQVKESQSERESKESKEFRE